MKKSSSGFLLLLPGIVFLLIPTLMGNLGLKPWKKLLINSGTIALSFFVGGLFLNPLALILPQVKFFKKLNCYRREIGLTTFMYAVFHFICFSFRLVEKKGWYDLSVFFKPVIYTGTVGLLILLPLALTSNNWSVRKLGRLKWKKLHRWIYLAEMALFIHLFLRDRLEALLFFLPLFIFQILRMKKKRIIFRPSRTAVSNVSKSLEKSSLLTDHNQ